MKNADYNLTIFIKSILMSEANGRAVFKGTKGTPCFDALWYQIDGKVYQKMMCSLPGGKE